MRPPARDAGTSSSCTTTSGTTTRRRQPILADIPRNGSIVPVVIQLTKTGLVFVFERVTGLPVFGLEERAVPRSEVPGEETSPTQPFPIAPAPLVRTQPVTKGELHAGHRRSRARNASGCSRGSRVAACTRRQG